jgi:chromosome segregation ATPase
VVAAIDEKERELSELTLLEEKQGTVDTEISVLADAKEDTRRELADLIAQSKKNVDKEQRLLRELKDGKRKRSRLESSMARLRDEMAEGDTDADAKQQKFREAAADRDRAESKLEAKVHAIQDRLQDLQARTEARDSQIKSLEQVQEGMEVALEGSEADCAHAAEELAALRPHGEVEADLHAKQLALQRVQDQIDSDAKGTLSLMLERAGLDVVLEDMQEDLGTLGLTDATADSVFADLGAERDEYINFDQFTRWLHYQAGQQQMAAAQAASDMHEDEVQQREQTLAELELALEPLEADIDDLKRTLHRAELAQHHATERTAAPMILTPSS